MKKDKDIIFDFILEKMLKPNERVLFSTKLLYNDSITGDYLVYKVVTVDEKSRIRIYVKDLQNTSNGYIKATEG